MTTEFNKRAEFDALLSEKVSELKRICHMHKIPMFVTFCIENNEKESVYEKEMISCATCGFELTDDQIAKHVNVSLGFDTIQPTSALIMAIDDLEPSYLDEEEEGDYDDEE